MKRSLVGVLSVATVGMCVCAPGAVAATPHLCKWAAGSASTLELEGGCHERAVRRTHATPLGSVTTVLYTAKWGVASQDPGPQHLLGIALTHAGGSSAALAYLKKRARANILNKDGGGLVAASKGLFAGWSGETVSCKNPPTGDCTLSHFEGLKGNWEVVVSVTGAPPGNPAAQEEESSTGDDDAQDVAQEELLKGPTVGVGMAVLGGV